MINQNAKPTRLGEFALQRRVPSPIISWTRRTVREISHDVAVPAISSLGAMIYAARVLLVYSEVGVSVLYAIPQSGTILKIFRWTGSYPPYRGIVHTSAVYRGFQS